MYTSTMWISLLVATASLVRAQCGPGGITFEGGGDEGSALECICPGGYEGQGCTTPHKGSPAGISMAAISETEVYLGVETDKQFLRICAWPSSACQNVSLTPKTYTFSYPLLSSPYVFYLESKCAPGHPLSAVTFGLQLTRESFAEDMGVAPYRRKTPSLAETKCVCFSLETQPTCYSDCDCSALSTHQDGDDTHTFLGLGLDAFIATAVVVLGTILGVLVLYLTCRFCGCCTGPKDSVVKRIGRLVKAPGAPTLTMWHESDEIDGVELDEFNAKADTHVSGGSLKPISFQRALTPATKHNPLYMSTEALTRDLLMLATPDDLEDEEPPTSNAYQTLVDLSPVESSPDDVITIPPRDHAWSSELPPGWNPFEMDK